MAQTIRIKRSTSTTTPSTLSAGELAYSGKSDSNKLFIGHPDGTTGVVAIGGQYYTGVIDGAASANTAGKLVLRDGSGNFSAGTITATLSGNASTATLLATARNIGGVSFNGSANINLPGVNTSGNQDTSGNAATATLATQATTLQNARTISGTSFNGSANITLNTSGITENTNLYYTQARADARVDAGFTAKSTSNLSEGTNLYFTNARVDTRVDTILKHAGHGNITVADGANGKLVLTAAAQYADSDARGAISVSNDSGGDGSLSYNNSTGVITYSGPSASEVRARISAGTGISYNSTTGTISSTITQYNNTAAGNVFDTKLAAADTDDLSEGSTNLYHTTARARAAISGSTGVSVSNGAISIGQAVATTSNVTFNNVSVDGTLSSDDITAANMTASGNVIVTGNLTVNGTTTTVNSNTVAIGDAIMTLNSDEAGTPSANAGLEVERGTATNVSLLWNETNDNWTVSDGSATSVLLTAANFGSTYTGAMDGGTF